MRILRAPARITLLPPGSKLGRQGTAKGMKIGNAWWVRKHKRVLCEFYAHLSGSHFCCKYPNCDPKGQPKECKWEMSDGQKNINDFYANFARTCQDHTFAARTQIGTPRNNQRNENGKCEMGKKNINDCYVNFASSCQDHTFVARIQVGTSRDSQRNENGKCLMGKKT